MGGSGGGGVGGSVQAGHWHLSGFCNIGVLFSG